MLLLFVQPFEEFYNCNNPNLVNTDLIHICCPWNEQDFYTAHTGIVYLRPKRKKDNFIKAYYRRKYWDAKQESKI